LQTYKKYHRRNSILKTEKENAFVAVNHELIAMYWEIGKYVSNKVKINAWGKGVVEDFSSFVQKKYLGIKGFSAQNLWRMKQFYETYESNEKLSPLVREIGYGKREITGYAWQGSWQKGGS